MAARSATRVIEPDIKAIMQKAQLGRKASLVIEAKKVVVNLQGVLWPPRT